MSFVVKKLPLAEQDALDAAIWYEERRPGLGEEFLDEVDRAVRALGNSALHNLVRFADVRRVAVARFKFYGICYTVRENEVWILAILYGRRHPRRACCRTASSGSIEGRLRLAAKTSRLAACAPQV